MSTFAPIFFIKISFVLPPPSLSAAARTDSVYADTVAISISDDGKRVTAMYSDRSLYVWGLGSSGKVGGFMIIWL